MLRGTSTVQPSNGLAVTRRLRTAQTNTVRAADSQMSLTVRAERFSVRRESSHCWASQSGPSASLAESSAVNTTRHRLMVEVFGCLSRMYASNSCEAEAGGLTSLQEATDPSLAFPAMIGDVGGSKAASWSRCLSSDQSPLARRSNVFVAARNSLATANRKLVRAASVSTAPRSVKNWLARVPVSNILSTSGCPKSTTYNDVSSPSSTMSP